MSRAARKEPRFPCHIYEIADAKEVYDSFRGELVKEYGDNVTLDDGTVLHENYMWDDGRRSLVRCKECGGLVIVQSSEYHSFLDSPDGYYRDWIPAASEEEADLLSILFDATELEVFPAGIYAETTVTFSGRAIRDLRLMIPKNWSGRSGRNTRMRILSSWKSWYGMPEKERTMQAASCFRYPVLLPIPWRKPVPKRPNG